MIVEFLIATTNRTDLSFLQPMFSKLETSDYRVLVINQCISIPLVSLSSDDSLIRCISVAERGISRSRNLAIANASGDVCVICDDDTVFEADVVETIRQATAANPDVSVFTFKIVTPAGKPYKAYPSESMALEGSFRLMRVSSIEIVFRREAIQQHKIQFTEWLGLGTDFSGGEEVVFLKDCQNKKLKLRFINQFIVQHPVESSGKAFHKPSNAMANGAMLKKLYPVSYFAWVIYFGLKRRKYYRGHYSVFAFLKLMFSGSNRMKADMRLNRK